MPEQPNYDTDTQASADRRRSPRICCTGFAECVSIDPNHLFRGEIRNVSETGCFISVRASVKLPPGTCVQLRFRMGRAEYSALASVVESMPAAGIHRDAASAKSGIRMRFIATDPAFTERMHRILSANPNTQ